MGSLSKTGDGVEEGFNINVYLECEVTDSDIVEISKQELLPVIDDFSPELIVISIGFVSRQDDLLTYHQVSDQGFLTLTTMIEAIASKDCDGIIIFVLKRGYNIQGNAGAVITHLKSLTI